MADALARLARCLSAALRHMRAAYLRYRADTAERELGSIHPLLLDPQQLVNHRTAIDVWRRTAERLTAS